MNWFAFFSNALPLSLPRESKEKEKKNPPFFASLFRESLFELAELDSFSSYIIKHARTFIVSTAKFQIVVDVKNQRKSVQNFPVSIYRSRIDFVSYSQL